MVPLGLMMGSGQTHKVIIALIVGLVVGFGAGWLAFSPATNLSNSTDEDRDILTEEDIPDLGETGVREEIGVSVESNLIEIKDQLAGETVFISRVALKRSGWVAIQDDDNGQPGGILGARRFNAGTFQGIATLLRNTENGNTYHATLWYDNGDRVFDHNVDERVRDVDGRNVSISFEAY